MRAHKSITFWFEKVTSNLYVMLKSLVAKNVSQRKLLVGDFELNTSFSKSRCTLPKLWKLSNPEVRLEYGNCVHRILTVTGPKSKTVCLMHVILCGWTRGGKPKRKETWWWNEADSHQRKKMTLERVAEGWR